MQLRKLQVRECIFSLEVGEGMAKIRFPCSFFFELKTANGRHCVASKGRNRVVDGVIAFRETVDLTVLMVYDGRQNLYRKKQAMMTVNLLSNSRPHQPKLVGRVSLDLGAVANGAMTTEISQHALEYCSVEAWLKFGIRLQSAITTSMDIGEMDRSQGSEIESQSGELEPKRKEEIKSDVLDRFGNKVAVRDAKGTSVSSSSVQQQRTPKFSQVNVMDRLRKIKTEKEEYSRNSLEVVGLKRDQKLGSNKHVKFVQEVKQMRPEIRARGEALQVPALDLNCSEFESSSRVSQQSNQQFQKQLVQRTNGGIEKARTDKEIVLKESSADVISSCKDMTVSGEDRGVDVGQRVKKVQQVSKGVVQGQTKQFRNDMERQLREKLRKMDEQLLEKDQMIKDLKIKKLQADQELQKCKLLLIPYDISLAELSDANREIQILREQLQGLKDELQIERGESEGLRQRMMKQLDQIAEMEHQQGNIESQSQESKGKLGLELQNLRHALSSEKMGHQTTLTELNELRQFYGQLQINNQNTSKKYIELQKQLQQIRQNNNTQAQTKDEERQTLLMSKEEQIFKLKIQVEEANALKDNAEDRVKGLLQDNYKLSQQLIESERKRCELSQELSKVDVQIYKLTTLQAQKMQKELKLIEVIDELKQIKGQLKRKEMEVVQGKTFEKELRDSMQQLGQQFEQKQLKVLQLAEDLQLQKTKGRDLTSNLEALKFQFQTTGKSRDTEKEAGEVRVKDLVERLKEKEARIVGLQRDVSSAKRTQEQQSSVVIQWKQRLREAEKSRLFELQRSNVLQSELKQIKGLFQRQVQENNQQKGRLKAMYEEQIQKRRKLSNQISQNEARLAENAGSKLDDECQLVDVLRGKVERNAEKQKLFRQNFQLMESEVNTIASSLQEKDEGLQQLAQFITVLTHNNQELNLRLGQLQNQLLVANERCEALTSEVELLNAYLPEQSGQSDELMELNRRLNEKNRGLLSQIEEKNMLIGELQRSLGEQRDSSEKMREQSRQVGEQRRQLQGRVAGATEQTERLYQQFKRVNMKYEQELEAIERINSERTTELMSEMDNWRLKVKQYERKQLQFMRQTSKKRQRIQILEGELAEKESRMQTLRLETMEAKQASQSLKGKVDVLNNQYEGVYSELGEKEFMLYEINGKLKDIEDKMALQKQQKQSVTSSSGKIEFELRQRLNIYEMQVDRLRQLQQSKDAQMTLLQKELNVFKKNSPEPSNLSKEYEQQLMEMKRLEEQNLAKIYQLQQQIKRVKEGVVSREDELRHSLDLCQNTKSEKITLEARIDSMERQRQFLRGQIQNIKEKQSDRSTPVHQFYQSPPSSVIAKDRNDFNLVADELSQILVRRRQDDELEGVLRLVIDNNARSEDQMKRLGRDRGVIQEKAKMASKQIQKMKAGIMKGAGRSIGDKTMITSMLRPIETAISQLITLSETLAEIDIDEEGDEEAIEVMKQDI